MKTHILTINKIQTITLAKLYIFTMTMLWCHYSHSYNFTSDFNSGVFWQQFPINMISDFSENQTAHDLASILKQALEAWHTSTQTDLWSVFSSSESSSTNTQNSIRWSINFEEETGYDANNTLAVAIRYSQGLFFTKTQIILNGTHYLLEYNIDNAIYKTILHELGHTLGIGHSEHEAIMAPYINDIEELTNDDKLAVNKLLAETSKRQEIALAFGSDQDLDDFQKILTQLAGCGSISSNNSFSSSGGGQGPGTNTHGQFLFSLMVGIIAAYLSFLPNKNFVGLMS